MGLPLWTPSVTVAPAEPECSAVADRMALARQRVRQITTDRRDWRDSSYSTVDVYDMPSEPERRPGRVERRPRGALSLWRAVDEPLALGLGFGDGMNTTELEEELESFDDCEDELGTRSRHSGYMTNASLGLFGGIGSFARGRSGSPLARTDENGFPLMPGSGLTSRTMSSESAATTETSATSDSGDDTQRRSYAAVASSISSRVLGASTVTMDGSGHVLDYTPRHRDWPADNEQLTIRRELAENRPPRTRWMRDSVTRDNEDEMAADRRRALELALLPARASARGRRDEPECADDRRSPDNGLSVVVRDVHQIESGQEAVLAQPGERPPRHSSPLDLDGYFSSRHRLRATATREDESPFGYPADDATDPDLSRYADTARWRARSRAAESYALLREAERLEQRLELVHCARRELLAIERSAALRT
ncbi:uncharacterized protein V1510DRAFT_410687 [Dipodascopsis tothii]|uniref:uncharacterized protein n=1 Tax=Dipodascopsis tothii TaxID=44089 RepID=UPI0034CDAE7F